jgi:hypothetical protein
MGNDEVFVPSLIKLGKSLTGSSGGSSGSSSSSISERTTCIVTLLRVLDNILAEHATTTTTSNGGVAIPNTTNKNAYNARLRKIKVSGGPFHTRVGKYDGGIDFLVACGFRRVLLLGTGASSTTPSVEQLKLRQEDEDPIRLFTGRCQLIIFALNVLQLSSSQWPDCPYKVITSTCTTQKLPLDCRCLNFTVEISYHLIVCFIEVKIDN